MKGRLIGAAIASLAAGPALACSGNVPSTCNGCTTDATIQIQPGQLCRVTLSQGLMAMLGARVVQQPRFGRAGVAPGPYIFYQSARPGPDRFVVQLTARDRFNRLGVTTIRFRTMVMN